MSRFKPPSPPFIRARYQGGSQKPKAIVLHGTVSSDNRGTARNIALWWNGPTSPKSSCHYVVDPGEVIQCVGDHSVAYHCGYNYGSIGVEFCDEQTGPANRWRDADSTAILKRAARLVAELCLAYDIEPKRPWIRNLKRKGPHGIYGHNDSRLAFGRTSHTDPRDFPWRKFLRLVRREIRAIKRAERRPAPKNTFKVLHAPLHGPSVTKAEILRALRRDGVMSVVFSEAYMRGGFLKRRKAWRAVVGGGKRRDARGRRVKRDVAVLVRSFRKHLEHGLRLGSKQARPLKIAPERWIVYSVDNVKGKPLATIGFHAHAAPRAAWRKKRGRQYRRGMRQLVALVNELRAEYGKDLAITVVGDLNYPDVKDGRRWAPRQVFQRLELDWFSQGLDWVAYSKSLRLISKRVISREYNGQDHPWLEGEFTHR